MSEEESSGVAYRKKAHGQGSAHSISDELESHILNLVLGKGLA